MTAAARAHLDLININETGAGCVYTQGNDCVLLPSAQEKYKQMFAELKNAKESINVLYFIIAIRN